MQQQRLRSRNTSSSRRQSADWRPCSLRIALLLPDDRTSARPLLSTAPGHRWIGALFLLGGLSHLASGVVGGFHTSDRSTTIWNEATEPYLKKVGTTFGKVIWWVVKLAFFGAAIALTVWIANGAYEAMSLKALAGVAVALLVYIAFFRE